jgi:hypothetical protein
MLDVWLTCRDCEKAQAYSRKKCLFVVISFSGGLATRRAECIPLPQQQETEGERATMNDHHAWARSHSGMK